MNSANVYFKSCTSISQIEQRLENRGFNVGVLNLSNGNDILKVRYGNVSDEKWYVADIGYDSSDNSGYIHVFSSSISKSDLKDIADIICKTIS